MPEIILKSSGRTKAIKRFQQMEMVRSILRAQNSSHLVIPKARLCGDFLVEQRLPINTDSYHNMELYSSQPQLFDQAVREFTRLFSKIYLSDLVSHQHNPLGHIEEIEDFVRYDNLPLYIVEKDGKKEGKIGLIDLEHIQDVKNSTGIELKTLVRIFPLHLDLIKEEAAILKMQFDQNSLTDSAEKGKKYLQIGFSDHLQWLNNKKISISNAFQIFEINPQREQELISLLKKELLKLNRGENDVFKRKKYIKEIFFTGDEEQVAEELANKVFLLLIEAIKFQIWGNQSESERLGKLSKPMSESQLVRLRSPIIKRPKLYAGVKELINTHKKIKFKNNSFYESRDIAEQLTYIIMQELVKGRATALK